MNMSREDLFGFAEVKLAGREVLSSQVGADVTATWANNATANTAVTIDITSTTTPVMQYELTCYNPSTETGLTVAVYQKKLALGGDDRYALLTTVPYSAAVTLAKILEPLFVGSNVIRLVITNDLPVTTGTLVAYFRLEAVN